jgi:hypothetical protein
MPAEMIIRFILGGLVVCVFAVIGDVLKPKSFAGIFGAAPSIALVTLALAFAKEDAGYAAFQARSMLAGSAGLLVYSLLLGRLLLRREGQAPFNALTASTLGWFVWLAVALTLWAWLFR